MSQPKKRFGRSRNAQDETQQFSLTEEDRELAALAAEILPRNSAAASFERAATRQAGSTSVSARDAVTDTELAGDPGTDSDTAAQEPEATATPSTKRTKRRKKAGAQTSATASSDAVGTAGADDAAPQAATAGAEDTAEETPAETKARIKAARQAKRREEKAAKAEAREHRATEYRPTPMWFKVIMIGLMIVGLLWIIAYYLFQGLVPIPGIGEWNLFIGLGFMLAGLIMTTQWR
ncbi:cell division protein CrgA [Kocuria rhizophila]|uniref:cell division protein CrgA n=1 Tax=Kocuria rhizophila TaxID=72000 RepID=UPI000EB1F8D4|nr:cell division protein CrgA [Kocuria rhizophila]WSZ53632.1 cell division protein CrgA [Kocuria rhizophila]